MYGNVFFLSPQAVCRKLVQQTLCRCLTPSPWRIDTLWLQPYLPILAVINFWSLNSCMAMFFWILQTTLFDSMPIFYYVPNGWLVFPTWAPTLSGDDQDQIWERCCLGPQGKWHIDQYGLNSCMCKGFTLAYFARNLALSPTQSVSVCFSNAGLVLRADLRPAANCVATVYYVYIYIYIYI